jgi:putative alpha-1,2-mannosidase
VSTGPIEVPTTEVGLGYEDEVASPGYYAVHLPSPGVTVEATATTRAGILRLAFEGGEANVMVNAGPGLSWFGADGHVRVRSPTELEGYATTGSA